MPNNRKKKERCEVSKIQTETKAETVAVAVKKKRKKRTQGLWIEMYIIH